MRYYKGFVGLGIIRVYNEVLSGFIYRFRVL